MKYFKKLVGERIYLSPMNVEDSEQYVKWLNDFRTTDGVGHSCQLVNLEGEKEWIEETLKNNKYNFAIVKLENDELIGSCGIDSINPTNRHATLGIFIGDEENRSKGYGAETLKKFSKFPHVGEVLFQSEQDKVIDLMQIIYEELEKRKSMFSDYN